MGTSPAGAQPLEHLEAVHARQRDIEDDRIERLGGRALDAAGAVVFVRDRVAERLEVLLDQPAEIAVVVDDEHAHPRVGGGVGRGRRDRHRAQRNHFAGRSAANLMNS